MMPSQDPEEFEREARERRAHDERRLENLRRQREERQASAENITAGEDVTENSTSATDSRENEGEREIEEVGMTEPEINPPAVEILELPENPQKQAWFGPAVQQPAQGANSKGAIPKIKRDKAVTLPLRRPVEEPGMIRVAAWREYDLNTDAPMEDVDEARCLQPEMEMPMEVDIERQPRNSLGREKKPEELESEEEKKSKEAEEDLVRYIGCLEIPPRVGREEIGGELVDSIARGGATRMLRVPPTLQVAPPVASLRLVPIITGPQPLLDWDLEVEEERDSEDLYAGDNEWRATLEEASGQSTSNKRSKRKKKKGGYNPNRQWTADDYFGSLPSPTRSLSPLGPAQRGWVTGAPEPARVDKRRRETERYVNDNCRPETSQSSYQPRAPPREETPREEMSRRRRKTPVRDEERERTRARSQQSRSRLNIKISGIRYKNVQSIQTDPRIDPAPYTCFNCWQKGHDAAHCPQEKRDLWCNNCGRRFVTIRDCPRCGDAHRRAQLGERRETSRNRREPSRTRREVRIAGENGENCRVSSVRIVDGAPNNQRESREIPRSPRRNRLQPRRSRASREENYENSREESARTIDLRHRLNASAQARRGEHQRETNVTRSHQPEERRNEMQRRTNERPRGGQNNRPRRDETRRAEVGNDTPDNLQDTLRLLEELREVSPETRRKILRRIYKD